jgi:predicted RNase H-like nuclease
VYPRAVYEAETHAEASALAIRFGHGGVSRQAYALRARLLELDAAVRSSTMAVREVHPEVSFRAMASAPLQWGKRSWNGMNERLALLAAQRFELPHTIEEIDSAGTDDLLDAAAAAWSAARIACGEASSLPDPPQRIGDREVAIWH